MEFVASEEYEDYEKYKKHNQPKQWHHICFYIYPFVVLFVVFLTWTLAVHRLGFMPNPSQHDPKFLGFPINILHHIFVPLFYMIPVVIFGAVKSLMWHVRNRNGRLLLPVLLWVSMIYLMIFPFRQMFLWFID